MQNNTTEDLEAIEEKIELRNQGEGGRKEFYWIAGLSLLNTILWLLLNSEWNFPVGLGITQLIDGFALGMAEEMGSSSTWLIKGGALLLDAVFLALFVLFGRLALGNRKVYLAGMIIYALDSLIPLVFGDYIGFGFHLLILYWLYQGFQAQRRMVTDQQLATQQ